VSVIHTQSTTDAVVNKAIESESILDTFTTARDALSTGEFLSCEVSDMDAAFASTQSDLVIEKTVIALQIEQVESNEEKDSLAYHQPLNDNMLPIERIPLKDEEQQSKRASSIHTLNTMRSQGSAHNPPSQCEISIQDLKDKIGEIGFYAKFNWRFFVRKCRMYESTFDVKIFLTQLLTSQELNRTKFQQLLKVRPFEFLTFLGCAFNCKYGYGG
jgi:hypothetical protein